MRQKITERVLMETKKSQETTKILQKGIGALDPLMLGENCSNGMQKGGDKRQSIVRIGQHEPIEVNVIIKSVLKEEATGEKKKKKVSHNQEELR